MSETTLILRSVDQNMQAYGGFTWPRQGKVEAPDWSSEPVAGGGLHGLLWGQGDQSLMANPEDKDAIFLVCSVDKKKIVDIGNKVKFPAAEVIFNGDFKRAWRLIWQTKNNVFPPMRYYYQALPENLTSIAGNLDLRSYHYPLPTNLVEIDGDLDLRGYTQSLPEGLTKIGGTVFLRGYPHALPQSLLSVGSLDLSTCDHSLANGIAGVASDLYNHPLPINLTSIGGDLELQDYAHPLPQGISSLTGSLYLRAYEFPLPANLSSVDGSLYLSGYNHPLPNTLAEVGGSLYLEGYQHALHSGLKSVKGQLFGWGYKHILPKGLSFA